ncbi:MAG: Cysteine desulfurase [Parcubacteria group bacterium GW2011_GWA2_40_14]|nr:MAG: Cysteine desulfurase [Parcubacteria group bacterium GW2011_GWA2_40_14]
MFWKKKDKRTPVVEHSSLRGRVFLDYVSTTPVVPEVVEKMREVERELWANPSALYGEAISAKEKLVEARQSIANILGCQKNDIVFTSGGTESNNLALLGIFEANRTKDFTPHIVTTKIEHSSILETCKEIERRGGQVTYLPVSNEGIVSIKDVKSAIKENTVLVSVMYANNEIGTIQPIKEIGRIIKNWRQKNMSRMPLDIKLPYFHTDACQGASLTLDLQKLGVDMMTLDGIKMYGPRGAGILYVKSGTNISPVLFGGGQERGLRSGTENLPAAVGLACAMELAEKMKERESVRLTEIRDYAILKILETFPEASLNGSGKLRLPNNINICFPGLDAEFAVISLDVLGIACSYSSSCQTLKEDSSSYVISALGKADCNKSSLRFTLGRESTKEDIDNLVLALQKIIKQN